MKKILIILSVFLSIGLQAQGILVRGTVKDGLGKAVPGVAVLLEGSSHIGTVSDEKGAYSINLPAAENQVLIFSCLSYVEQRVKVNKSDVIDVILREDATQLEEIVVVGYGSMRKSDLTGSVASVTVDDSKAAQSTSLDQLLQGKASGVQIVSNSASPDAGVNIRIRGMSSLTGSSQPLFVVDGIILTDANSSSMLSYGSDNTDSYEATNSLMGLNPRDIASIEILKDASATAIYGSEGANGVVLITTRMAKTDKQDVFFSAGLDYVAKYKRLDVLTFDDYVSYVEYNTLNEGRINILNRMFDNYVSPSSRGELKVTPVDWQDYSLRNAFRQRYYYSISGRPKDMSYTFSLGFNKNDGIVRTTGSNQLTVRMNLEKTIADRITLGTKFNLSNVNSSLQQGSNGGRQFASGSMMRSILVSKPYYSGNLSDYDDADEDWDTIEEDSKSTPNRWIKDAYNRRFQYRITPSAYASLKLGRSLNFKLTSGADYNVARRTKWKGASINRTSGGATASVNDDVALRWNVDALLNFNKVFARVHNVSGTLGATYTDSFNSTQSVLGYNIRQYELQSDNINSAPNTMTAYSESKSSTMSAFLRLIYNYKDRYVLTGTLRADGSSRFRKENRYSFFPSFAAAWRISQEPWFNSETVSSAKLRLGWGMVGNAGVSPYQTYVTYSANKYPSHDPSSDSSFSVGIIPSNIANPNLKWETTSQWNLGLDLGLWNGRFAVTADLYDKYTYDLLNRKNIAITSGFSTTWVNQGIISNKGLELSLNAVPIKTRNFELMLNANISFNRNSIINIGTDSEGDYIFLNGEEKVKCNYYLGDQIGNGRYFAKAVNIFAEGQPIGLFYGLKTDGIVQEGESGPGFSAGTEKGPGSIRYCDLNGNGYIDDEDRTIIGDPNPDFTYGFGLDMSWGRFSFSMSFNGSYGNDICNSNLNQLLDTQYNNLNNVLRDAVVKAWTPENTQTVYPALGMYVSNLDSQWFSSLNVEDGSYLRISKLSVAYKQPLKKRYLRSFNVGLSVSNPYVWTRYSGWDPEVSSFGDNMRRIGIDNGSYPSSRIFCMDLKFSF